MLLIILTNDELLEACKCISLALSISSSLSKESKTLPKPTQKIIINTCKNMKNIRAAVQKIPHLK